MTGRYVGTTDVGGLLGLGAPDPEKTAKPAWYPRLTVLNTLAVQRGLYTMDEYRAQVESLPPEEYAALSYYDRRLWAVDRLVSFALPRLRRPGPRASSASSSPAEADPAFEIGDRVRVKLLPHIVHARVPRYVQGATGVIESRTDSRVPPESRITEARNRELAQPVYRVAFDSDSLWGTRQGRVIVELYQHQLMAE